MEVGTVEFPLGVIGVLGGAGGAESLELQGLQKLVGITNNSKAGDSGVEYLDMCWQKQC